MTSASPTRQTARIRAETMRRVAAVADALHGRGTLPPDFKPSRATVTVWRGLAHVCFTSAGETIACAAPANTALAAAIRSRGAPHDHPEGRAAQCLMRGRLLALSAATSSTAADVVAPGPGHSRRDRSLSVAINAGPDGFIVYSFSGDDWQTCRDYVREKLGLQPAAAAADKGERAQTTPAAPDGRERIALTLWDEARSISGTPAETYLASRGLSYEGRRCAGIRAARSARASVTAA